MYIHMYVYIYIYICIHTNTHTYTYPALSTTVPRRLSCAALAAPLPPPLYHVIWSAIFELSVIECMV